MWLSCTVLLYMFNITPLERRIWIVEEGEELGKEVNSAHVTGLNVTENQQDSKTEKTAVYYRDLEPEAWEGNKSASKESSRRK